MGKIAALPYNLQSFYLSEPVIVWLHTENKKRGLLKTEFCLKATSKFINTLVEIILATEIGRLALKISATFQSDSYIL